MNSESAERSAQLTRADRFSPDVPYLPRTTTFTVLE